MARRHGSPGAAVTAPLSRQEINRRAQAVRRIVLRRFAVEHPDTYRRWCDEAYAALDAETDRTSGRRPGPGR